jgi:hypothetical protein
MLNVPLSHLGPLLAWAPRASSLLFLAPSSAAVEHRVGDAFERLSVAVSDRGSGAASVIMAQRALATLATFRLRTKHGFCPRTTEVNLTLTLRA